MFGKKKDKENVVIENKVINIEIEPLNIVNVKVTTDEGEADPFLGVTNLDDSELKQLLNDFVAERGRLDLYLDEYHYKNGYNRSDLRAPMISASKGIKAYTNQVILK